MGWSNSFVSCPMGFRPIPLEQPSRTMLEFMGSILIRTSLIPCFRMRFSFSAVPKPVAPLFLSLSLNKSVIIYCNFLRRNFFRLEEGGPGLYCFCPQVMFWFPYAILSFLLRMVAEYSQVLLELLQESSFELISIYIWQCWHIWLSLLFGLWLTLQKICGRSLLWLLLRPLIARGFASL